MEDPVQSLVDADAALQPFLLAAHESASNASTLRALVMKVLSEPEIFAGYDEIKAIMQPTLQKAAEGEKLLNTLDLFSYGTYEGYVQSAPNTTYLSLNDAQLWKLRQLSVLSLVQQACQQKTSRLSYETVKKSLQLPDYRATEQILVSCIYARVVSGQLCQKTQCLLLGCPGGHSPPIRPRDVPLSEVSNMIDTIRAFQQRLQGTSVDLLRNASDVQSHLDNHRRFVNLALDRKKKSEILTGSGGGICSSLLLGRASLDGGGDAMDLSGSGGNASRGGASSSARRQKRSRGGLTAGIADASFGRFQA